MQRLLNRRQSLSLGALSLLTVWPAWAHSPQRLVAVGGAITETLYRLGAQSELVGVDTTSLFPAEAQRLPSVGYARSLSAEGLLALKPSLILASSEAGPPAVLRQLEAARVPLHILDAPHSAAGVAARTRRIGELLGRAPAAAQLASQIEADCATVQRRIAQGRKSSPRVLFVLAHSPSSLRLGGQGTAAHAMLSLAGGLNAFGEVEGFKPLNAEAALAARPEILLTTTQGLEAMGGVDGLLALPGLAGTPAGKAKRVVALDALLMLGFGPRLPQALAQLAEGLGTV